MPTHFLFPNIFPKRNFSETQKVSSTKCFGTEKQTISKHSCDAHNLFSLTFFPSGIFSETQKGSSTKCLGTVRQKLSTENCEIPPPPHKKFRFQNFRNTKRFHYEMFRYCEPKKLTRIVMPVPFVYLNIFQYQKLSETQKGSSTECFATEKQTISKDSRDAQTLYFSNVFSIWRTIWNTEGFLDELFWFFETKKSYGESWYPSPFYAWKVSMLDFFWNEEVFPNEMFQYCETKNMTENLVMPTPFLIHNTFRSQKVFEAQYGSSTKCFGTVRLQRREKHSADSHDTPRPPMHQKYRY